MNGRMHLGHTFAMSKAEFAARYHRMLGERVLWPFAFHCTGMPIKAAADKLQAEIRQFGSPPAFPEAPHFGRVCTSYALLEERQFVHKQTLKALDDAAAAAADGSSATATVAATTTAAAGASKKAKVTQKTGGVKRQWDILLASGVDAAEIPKFQQSTYWLKYFPAYYIADLQAMGAAIDMRRAFITTDANPFYDAFIQWQYRTLQREGKLKFGKRHSVYSPKDGQACADHDRASGEGVTPQEYTVVKLRVVEPLPAVLAPLAGRRIYLAPATLRPETMYGQTNCFVLPTGDYGAYEVSAAPDGDVFVMSEQGALNFAHQGYAPAHGQIKRLAAFKGADIIGAALRAPLTSYATVYTLPMLTIKMTKGTGVVTSVPSDAPDDFAALRDMQKKADFRAKYGLKDEMVLPFAPVPIIETTQFGKLSAVTACEQFKVNSQNDAAQLALAKDEVYKAGFYDGVFLVGEFAGQKVSDAKDKVRRRLVDAGDAVPYWEPMSTVVSRSGETCVVALTDQWYVDYAQPEWKAAVRAYVERGLETFSGEMRHLLLDNVDRLHEWGCSRSFGLGTRLPADPQFLIESLSDSTIYMAYYTIAHLLQAGNVDPDRVVVGPAGLQPAQCTDAFFDYVFRGEGDAAAAAPGVDAALLARLRREFTFWYPWDVRTSGRDLAYNHLPFSLFHHVALFKPEHWPRAIKCCAFLEVDGKKMSKSEGNFLTLADGVERFSADGMRIALADAGDTLEVANFDQSVANMAILRLHALVEIVDEALAASPASDAAAADAGSEWDERVFEQQQLALIADVHTQYQKMQFRDVLRRAFFEYLAIRERYVLNTETRGRAPRRAVLLASLKRQVLLIAPITPHVAEHCWRKLGGAGLAAAALMPPPTDTYDRSLVLAAAHLDAQMSRLRRIVETKLNPKAAKKGKVAEAAPAAIASIVVRITQSYPAWQARVLDVVRPLFNDATREFSLGDPVAALQADSEVQKLVEQAFPAPKPAAAAAAATPAADGAKPAKAPKGKNHALIFFGLVRTTAIETGIAALATKLQFDELALFQVAAPLLTAAFKAPVSVVESVDGKPGDPVFELK